MRIGRRILLASEGEQPHPLSSVCTHSSSVLVTATTRSAPNLLRMPTVKTLRGPPTPHRSRQVIEDLSSNLAAATRAGHSAPATHDDTYAGTAIDHEQTVSDTIAPEQCLRRFIIITTSRPSNRLPTSRPTPLSSLSHPGATRRNCALGCISPTDPATLSVGLSSCAMI